MPQRDGSRAWNAPRKRQLWLFRCEIDRAPSVLLDRCMQLPKAGSFDSPCGASPGCSRERFGLSRVHRQHGGHVGSRSVSHRGKAHSGVCAIAVASLLCGLNPASSPLGAQPLPWPADQPTEDSGASFDERFSSNDRAQPVFMHPDIQSLIAALPPSAPPADVLVADTESEPPSAENTASLPAAEAGATLPDHEMHLPEFPPPPTPAEVVLPSREELLAAQPQAPSPSSTEVAGMNASENSRQVEATRPAGSQRPAMKKQSLNSAAGQKAARVRKPSGDQHQPTATGSLPACRANAACLSQQQSFAIFFGFIAGALLGGPIGAIAGGTAGAIMTAPGTKQSSSADPVRR